MTPLAGGRYTVDLVVDGAASVGVVAHPSLLETPKDIEDLNKSSGHFLWLNAGEDGMFNKEKQNQAREILKGNDKHKMVGELVCTCLHFAPVHARSEFATRVTES